MAQPAAAIVYLALGTNLGDRSRMLADALRRLAPRVTLLAQSDVYETAPAYIADQPAYLNMVVATQTDLAPHALLGFLKEIEASMGRGAGLRWGPRPIDLDILIYGDLQLSTPDLVIPHPRMAERPFVLVPLAQLAPALVAPGFDATVVELARAAPPIGDVLAHLGPLETLRAD